MIIDTESLFFINVYILVEDDTNKDNSTALRSLKEIDSARDERDINWDNSKEELDITTIDSTNDKCLVQKFTVSMFSINLCTFPIIHQVTGFEYSKCCIHQNKQIFLIYY